MSDSSRFTIYIPSHNYGHFLEEAIESVLNQTVEDWELLLIDDGSVDNTHQIMDLYKGHSKIRIFREEGIGLPAVCNLALQHANGKYIIRLDGDDVFDPNILLVLGHYMDKDPELSLVFPDFYLTSESGEVFEQKRIRKIFEEDHLMDAPPNGACTMVRTEILRKIGGYREDLGAQDGFDLWTKIRKNYKSTNVNLPLFYYRRHGKNLTQQPLKIINARREIKKTATLQRLKHHSPVIAVIPCRRHYDFVEDLWKQDIAGRSLLQQDIEVCLNSGIIDRVVVTCDNPDAEKVVRSVNNPKVDFLLREEQYTLRSSRIAETLKIIAKLYDPEFKGLSVLRYIQTPFVTTGTIEEAITSLILSDAQSSCAVEEVHSLVYRRTSFGLLPINGKSGLIAQNETLYRDPSTCIALRNSNLLGGSLHGLSSVGFSVSTAECFFISSEHELEIARNLARKTENSEYQPATS
jgi:CMP-N-acetylneuraminic acid synthetase